MILEIVDSLTPVCRASSRIDQRLLASSANSHLPKAHLSVMSIPRLLQRCTFHRTRPCRIWKKKPRHPFRSHRHQLRRLSSPCLPGGFHHTRLAKPRQVPLVSVSQEPGLTVLEVPDRVLRLHPDAKDSLLAFYHRSTWLSTRQLSSACWVTSLPKPTPALLDRGATLCHNTRQVAQSAPYRAPQGNHHLEVPS